MILKIKQKVVFFKFEKKIQKSFIIHLTNVQYVSNAFKLKYNCFTSLLSTYVYPYLFVKKWVKYSI